MQDSNIITSSISYDNRKMKTSLQFCPEATAKVFEALTPYANEEFCPKDFENLPRDDSELNTPDDSPPPSSPASSPSIMVPERCSSDPSVSSGNQDQIVPSDQENEEQLAELLLYVKRTDIVDCDSALESKFFDALKPKESPQKKVLKYEYVSHTCEEHRKKHLRCPFNCKGRIVSRVPKFVSEDAVQDTIFEEMDIEAPLSPSYTPKGKISRSSSFSSGMEKESDDEDYSVESPKSKQRSKEVKKRQVKYTLPRVLQNSFGDEATNRVNTQKQQQEKDRIKRDREERVRARRIAAIRESLKALEHAYDEDSDVERVMSEQVQWLQDDKLFQQQNEKIINGKKKPFGTKTEIPISSDSSSLFSGLSVAVNSNAVNTTSSDDSSKGRRWVRFACERHRKEHAKCPDNCPNRVKQEMSMGSSFADKREPQAHIMGISST